MLYQVYANREKLLTQISTDKILNQFNWRISVLNRSLIISFGESLFYQFFE